MKTAHAALLMQRLLERLLPGLAGDQVPLVQERLDSHLLQLPRQVLDPRLVDAVVGEEDIVMAAGWNGHERNLLRGRSARHFDIPAFGLPP